MYKKSFYGYGRESVQEAVTEIEKKFEQELKEVNEEIEDAVKEHKQLYDRLNNMIGEYKRLRENTRQIKQLKEYMPYIVSQKKLNIEKEINEIREETEEYIHNINKHCQIIDEETEKIKQKIQVFVNSLSQLFVLRDVKEFDDIIRHFEQILNDYAPRKEILEPNDLSEDELLLESDEALLASEQAFLESDDSQPVNPLEDFLIKKEENCELQDNAEASLGLDDENIESLINEQKLSLNHGEVIEDLEENNKLLEEISPPKIAATVLENKRSLKKEKDQTQNSVNFSVQGDEVDELNELLKQFM